MALGLNATNLANKWLEVLGTTGTTAGTTFTGVSTGIWVKLHTSTGEPGAAGTSNASAEVDRKQISWASASGGSKAMSGTLSWTSWDVGTETIKYITLWDASTGGNFLWSGQLSSEKTVANGDTLNITSLTIALTPVAA